MNFPTISPSLSPDSDGLATLVEQMARFFASDSLCQIEWTAANYVTLVQHSLDRAPIIARECRVDETSPRLPVAENDCDTLFNLGSLSLVPDHLLAHWLAELRRLTRNNVWVALEATTDRNQVWWEEKFLEAGFRKHPLTMLVLPYPERERDATRVVLVLEKIPAAALARYPLAALQAECNLNMDMLREAGVRSEAHLARYQLATRHAPKSGIILDAACGLGYGSAMLARQFPGTRVIGIDISEYAIDYARANFASVLPNLEFHLADACELTMVAEESVDLVVSFETIEHVPDPELLLRGMARRMKPGARFIGSIPNLWLDETGKDPNPSHFHVFDLPKFYQLIAGFLQVSQVYRENAGGHLRRPEVGPDMREVQLPVTDQLEDAEWWLIAAQKAPVLLPAALPRPRIWLVDGDTRGHHYTGLQASLDAEWIVGGRTMPEELDLAVVSDEWWWERALVVQELKRRQIPTLHVMDGIIDWKNNWENPRSLTEEKGMPLFQPMLSDKVACLGQAQARVLASWGQAAKCEVIGVPRFDRYFGLKRRTRLPEQPARVLVMTANTPYFTEVQHADVLAALEALRDFFAQVTAAGIPIEPVWRLTKGLEDEIGVKSASTDFTGKELAEVLTTVDAVICSSSTAMLEAMLLGLPTALLDFSNVPHYLQPAWQITAAGQVGPVLGELLNPTPAKLLYQETVLHDALECASPAAPRLARLVADMINLNRQARAHGEAPVFPRGMAASTVCPPGAPENRFDLEQLYPEQPVFRLNRLAELQAELGHWRSSGITAGEPDHVDALIGRSVVFSA